MHARTASSCVRHDRHNKEWAVICLSRSKPMKQKHAQKARPQRCVQGRRLPNSRTALSLSRHAAPLTRHTCCYCCHRTSAWPGNLPHLPRPTRQIPRVCVLAVNKRSLCPRLPASRRARRALRDLGVVLKETKQNGRDTSSHVAQRLPRLRACHVCECGRARRSPTANPQIHKQAHALSAWWQ